jgi:putative glycosyltransferase (TIGR04372 family)
MLIINEGGKISVDERRELLERIEYIQATIANLDENTSANEKAVEYLKLAECALRFGDFPGIQHLFSHALDLDPVSPIAAIGLAKIMAHRGKGKNAIDVLLKVKEHIPDNADILHLLGELYWAERNIEEAQLIWSQIVFNARSNFIKSLGGPMEKTQSDFVTEVRLYEEKTAEMKTWLELQEKAVHVEKDLAWLKNIAGDRELFICAMHGKGWILTHMICQTEIVYRRLYGKGHKDILLVMLNPNEYCNEFLLNMYRRKFLMIDNRHPRLLKRMILLREWLKWQNSEIVVPVDADNPAPHARQNWPQHKKELKDTPPALKFTEQEQKRGKKLLGSFGMSETDDFIAFGYREQTYYQNVWSKRTSYEEYWQAARDLPSREHFLDRQNNEEHQQKLKNAFQNIVGDSLKVDTDSYISTVEKLAQQNNLFAFRMGLDVDAPLPNGLNDKVVDYASNNRSEFGDIYLLGSCKFVLSGGTGIAAVSAFFQRPTVFSDMFLLNIGLMQYNKDVTSLCIPRKYWLESEKRFLNFGEILDCCRFYHWSDLYDKKQFYQVANTPEEVWDVANEMNQRIDGTWEETPEDNERYEAFMALYQPRHEGYGMTGRVGAKFLEKYEELIC